MRTSTVAALLSLVTLVVFLPVTGYDFINYDDYLYVLENEVVGQGLSLEGIAWAFGDYHEANYHPVTWLSHMLDVELFGLWPGGHHLAGLLWHLANVVLLLFLLVRMTGNLWPSAFAAAVFALHPLHVESVAWISERKDVLSIHLGLWAIWAYLRFIERPTLWRHLGIVLVFVGSLLAKPTLVTLPCLLLLLDFWPLRRLRSFAVVVEKVPLFLLSFLMATVTYVSQSTSGAMCRPDRLPTRARIGNAFNSYGTYLLDHVWPTELSIFYPHPMADVPMGRAAACAAVVLVISLVVLWQTRRAPWAFVGWFWFLGTLVPMIGFVQVGSQGHADRFTYFPSVGLAIMVGWSIAAIPLPRRLVFGLGLAACALMAIVSTLQRDTWRDSITVFRRSLEVTERNYKAHMNLARAYHRLARAGIEVAPDEATLSPDALKALKSHQELSLYHLRAAAELDRDRFIDDRTFANAYNNLGVSYGLLGEPRLAAQHFATSLRYNPLAQGVRENLQMALLDAAERERAMTLP